MNAVPIEPGKTYLLARQVVEGNPCPRYRDDRGQGFEPEEARRRLEEAVTVLKSSYGEGDTSVEVIDHVTHVHTPMHTVMLWALEWTGWDEYRRLLDERAQILKRMSEADAE